MNESYRHNQILDLLKERSLLSTTEIMETFNISPATARRDINKLNEKGLLRKVRNGAEYLHTNEKKFTQTKTVNNADEKRRIAEAAAKLCENGQSVVLTCGSTMLLLADSLCGRNVQIITNYLPLANFLIEHNHDDVVIMGGQYNKNKAVTLSLNSTNEPAYAANIMFTSGKGMTTDGLYKTDMIIANSEQHILPKVSKLVALVDSSKLGSEVGMLFSKLKDIDLLVTGKEADPKIIQELRDKGLEVILA
ncbi:MAG: HTH-type transcriptional regulator UlaR [Aggregatibacter aphrophilus]|uniref:HTH-type transcriptional regulator UlaR n=1 Tax=Aggregatibacter aphrophilus TaxID=732 RepID=UPI00290AEE5D|nr:HTH-type transcriptional regulator UlaR [Aggregatibacter aphrophilus]MDU7785002.1 HTH-type transcriptional regulator UlaR [Aggregatibacter aphrophilus]